MKKKLLQEQREKAIIESFAKTFNKIKRLDENYMDEALDVAKNLKVGDRLEKLNAIMKDTVTIVKIEGDNVYIKPDSFDHVFQWTGSHIDDEIKRGKLKWLPKNEELDEVNLKTLVPAAAMAIGSMLPSNKAAAQNQMQQQPQGIEKSVASASAMGLPEKNRKFGKEIMDSYSKNPFTAEMWSEKSRENLRFFKTIKKLVNYYSGGGQVDDSDFEELGAMAQQSPVAMDFLKR